MAKKTRRDIESYTHAGKDRTNNPPVGLVTPDTDPEYGAKLYSHDPHIDPQLNWAGKIEQTSFEVPTVSLHVHERIDPRTIMEAVRKRNGMEPQPSLFDELEENPPIRHAIEFYKHRHNWTNRLIAGDSLLVMNSLLEKEGLGGKVQTIYIDPPYGIRYGSNFQPFVNRKEVKDRDDDLTAEPEQIRAFRDTWELGIHSYLTYLRDRFILTLELLSESGSCFVQIGDENVHRVGMLMDEVFGSQNRIATISYATSGGSSSNTLPEVADYLLWYGKHKDKIKYRQLYMSLSRKEIVEHMNWDAMVELANGECRSLTADEKTNPEGNLSSGARLYQRAMLTSQGESQTGRSEPYTVEGKTYLCPNNQHWRVSTEGLDRLHLLGRLDLSGRHKRLAWKNYEDEIPGKRLNNIWSDLARPVNKRYVVQTADKILQRCILMTSDPGDLIFDPTCGSGTAAYVSEKWGRRWITCDTSRVAISIARQKLMTANFDYYELNHPIEGIGAGIHCRSVKKVTAAVLGYGETPKKTFLHDQPFIDKSRARVTGPFTVEAVPAPIVKPIDEVTDPNPLPADKSVVRSGATIRHDVWREELLKTGIRGKLGQRISLERLEPISCTRWLHAEGRIRPKNSEADYLSDKGTTEAPVHVAVSFGPDHAPLEQRQVAHAIEEAQSLVPKPKVIVFAAFQFDPEASKDIDETNWPSVTLLKAQMNADLLTSDLKKKRTSNESFWLIGQPDVTLEKLVDGEDKGKYRVSVQGFDYYNTKTGNLESGGSDRIVLWMLDPDYDGRSLFARQVFFPMDSTKDGWTKLARNLGAEIDADLIEAYQGTQSLPFEHGEHCRAAVKIVDDRGIESLKIIGLS